MKTVEGLKDVFVSQLLALFEVLEALVLAGVEKEVAIENRFLEVEVAGLCISRLGWLGVDVAWLCYHLPVLVELP